MPGFWRRLLGNRSALIGLVILAVVGVTAAAAPVLFPGNPFRRAPTSSARTCSGGTWRRGWPTARAHP